MTVRNRPLSPHLQVYRLPLTAMMSISFRAAGVALTAGLLLLAYWLGAAAYGPEAFARAQGLLGSWFGILLLMGFSAALFYHIAHGIRHLIWDTGRNFEKPGYTMSGYLALAGAAVATVVAWVAGFASL